MESCQNVLSSINKFITYDILYQERGSQWTQKKIKSIMDWPVPKNAHEVHSFMGLARYH